MKKLLFLGIAVLMLFAACTQDENMVTDLNSTGTKSLVNNYIENYYPDAQVVCLNYSNGMTIATLSSGETLYFDATGNPITAQSCMYRTDSIGMDSTDLTHNDSINHKKMDFRHFRDSLMSSLKGELKFRFQNDSNLVLHKDSLIRSLKDSVNKLIRDSIRTIVFHRKQQRDSVINSIKMHRDSIRMHKDSIRSAKKSMEQAVKDYVLTHYPAFRLLGLSKESNCKGSYLIASIMQMTPAMTLAANKPVSQELSIKLYFDTEGNYAMKAERVLTENIPVEVTDASLPYTEYNLAKRAEKLTLADGTIEYRLYLLPKLDLTSGVVVKKVVLIVGGDGTIICE